MEREQRRLAAIVAADVVGYSRLMGRDESGTLAALKAHRTTRLEPALARHRGRLVKLTGDGALIEFSSAVDALAAAIEFQQAMAEANRDAADDSAIVFRIGVHLGDLIVDGEDLYGDGVNVAARLEGEAPAGGIVVSGDVHNAVAGRLRATFEDLGELTLKNIARPVRAWHARWSAADWPATDATPPPAKDAPLPLPDKPSIAVLPFQNMSGDPDQDYFADGMCEELTAMLARLPHLFVTARNSAFTYKGRAVDVRTVARELGVRHVLEGSVRKSGTRIRVTAQLVDAASGAHTWSDTYDRDLTDIFAVQEELGHAIAGALMPRIVLAEATLAARKRPESLDAWGFTVRALVRWWADATRPTADEVIRYVRAAVALDPQYGLAHGLLSNLLACCAVWNWTDDWLATSREAVASAERAMALSPHDSAALLNVALCHVQLGRFVSAARIAEQAVEACPNDAQAAAVCGWCLAIEGRTDEAVGHIERAFRLSPLDPQLHFFYLVRASAAFFAGRHQEAIAWIERCLRAKPGYPAAYLWGAAAQAAAGRTAEARRAIDKLRAQAPGVALEIYKRPRTEGTRWQKFIDAVTAAGV